MNKALLAMLVTFGPLMLEARIMPSWTYQQMYDKADLVVIADVRSTTETGEQIVLKDVQPNVPVLGVATVFEARLVIKGKKGLRTFRLHHYKFRSEDDKLAADSPSLLESPQRHQKYLLFLIREADGQYAPVTGQTDAAMFCVIELKSSAD
jgi:hypothetical protein